ncbi:MAG TPA: glycosyltransferase family 2 protein [Ohtaekwangia sp.]|nr:glycosyltransferase family 2 protein [Ohtaekwangia sp.]
MKVSVIISTYNAPEWLEKVLWAYTVQDFTNFEILIADDGSGSETRQLIESFAQQSSLDIKHVWHEDQGYRRQTILNKAIRESTTEYLIFTDGDCIPRRDFVATHVVMARRGTFLSGGYCKLPLETSKAITFDNIKNQEAFNVNWLKNFGSLGFSQTRKLFANGHLASFLDFITTAKATFNNCNSSAWKDDVLAVNGYDERMLYGGSDRELGERLVNYGLRGRQIRHRAIVVHLEHERSYKTRESMERNLLIRNNTRVQKVRWTPHGIVR